MGTQLSELPLNPFEDNVVFEPREAEPAVRGLNDRPLQRLMAQFARLRAEPLPRSKPVHLPAQLVTSPEPGFGKSHLIGRLFRALEGEATLVYLRPFQDPGSAWRSILLKVVQELDRPNNQNIAAGAPGTLTQLDAFTHGVFANLLAGLIETGKAHGEPEGCVKELRSHPLKAFGGGRAGHPLVEWVREGFPKYLPYLVDALSASGARLHSPARSWLKALFAYAYGNERPGQREAALEWLKGEGLGTDDAAIVGLEGVEIPRQTNSADERNEYALHRVHDLLSLAGFYRPFVFCFDQTEMLTTNLELCEAFGALAEELVAFGLNHMLVITANLDPWTNVISKNFQTAYQARFSDPIELEGIVQSQAVELLRKRLESCELERAEIDHFADSSWLKTQFAEKTALGVRSWLRQCGRRFTELASSQPQERSLEDYYRHYEAEVRSKPNRLVFDPDVLRWTMGAEAVGDAMSRYQSKPFKEKKGFFPIVWTRGDAAVLLGFEDSCNALRWQTILRETERRVAEGKEKGKGVRAVFFRTPEQRLVPGKGWHAIGPKFAAAKDYFAVRVISHEELTILYAAYDLFANVVEGNASFSREEALRFIREKLTPIWTSLLEAAPAVTPAPPTPTPDLLEQICHIASARHFLSLDQLTAQLNGSFARESVLSACQQLPQIRVFSTSQATAIKWLSSPSAQPN